MIVNERKLNKKADVIKVSEESGEYNIHEHFDRR